MKSLCHWPLRGRIAIPAYRSAGVAAFTLLAEPAPATADVCAGVGGRISVSGCV
ncbi:hypothetical protein HZU38_04040 [Mycolicibacterium vanbaalenii]|uniref:hypothetical protein n=1 Tax=Mycolicibacterium TaxID=1866885 RepID=UPI001CA3064E|nr:MULTISPECIES: hypothetical protein [Mycolicibacterium]QZT57367.1 hypothetical protein JN084_01715 [Mycolicibacterium austroafricanum]UJL29695.1 hypothetical protein HZU38_04040 [Mycolicibacterium vanbaalenii]WND57254.1 hypothetical protein QQA43_02230 [Mycolicibacterium vanbaalenii]